MMAEAILLTEDKEERHQVSIQLTTHTSPGGLIVLKGTLWVTSFLFVNALWLEVCHI